MALAELSGRELKDSARLFDLRRGLPGGEEVGEEGRATGGDGLGEGEEEVQQDPNPPFMRLIGHTYPYQWRSSKTPRFFCGPSPLSLKSSEFLSGGAR